jgi:hypothetical protein
MGALAMMNLQGGNENDVEAYMCMLRKIVMIPVKACRVSLIGLCRDDRAAATLYQEAIQNVQFIASECRPT